jgi:hypothetical protein
MSGVLLSLSAACLVGVGTAKAYTVSSSGRTAFDDLGQYLLLNGAHNWTEAQVQNCGTSNGNGGGYAARLGIAVTTGGSTVRLLGYLNSSTYYPVQKRDGTSRFNWNFGTRFQSNDPIRTGFSQYNGEGLHQWVWAWSYGP